MENNQNENGKQKLITEIFTFFWLLTEDKVIFRLIPESEVESIKDDYYSTLYDVIKDFYNDTKIFDINLNSDVLPYLDTIDNDMMNIFRYNISDMIKHTEYKLFDDTFYIEDAEFQSLFDNVIRAFRFLMVDIDKRKREKINEELKKSQELSKELKQVNQLTEDIKKSHKVLDDRANQLYKTIENIEKTVGNILPQAISVVGIFVAILVVYLGAEELIETLNRLFNDTPNYFFISLITISHVLFNLIFFLMFLLARISKSSINIRCTKFLDIKDCNQSNKELQSNKDIDVINESLKELLIDRRICANCVYANTEDSIKKGYFGKIAEESKEYDKLLAEQCGQFDKFIKKYAYIFFINIIFLFVELAFLFWWLLREKIFNDYIFEIVHPVFCLIAIVAISILTIILICKKVHSIGKKYSEKKTKQRRLIYIFSIITVLFLIIMILCYGLDLQYFPNRGAA